MRMGARVRRVGAGVRAAVVVAGVLAGVLPVRAVWAAGASAKQQASRERMASCSKEAASHKLTGEARRNWMKTCLSGATPAGGGPAIVDPPANETPQARMARCQKAANADHLETKARKAFLAKCLEAPKSAEKPAK